MQDNTKSSFACFDTQGQASTDSLSASDYATHFHIVWLNAEAILQSNFNLKYLIQFYRTFRDLQPNLLNQQFNTVFYPRATFLAFRSNLTSCKRQHLVLTPSYLKECFRHKQYPEGRCRMARSTIHRPNQWMIPYKHPPE